MPEPGRYVYFLGIFAVALVLRELLLVSCCQFFRLGLLNRWFSQNYGLMVCVGIMWCRELLAIGSL
jgi:hypothetical protein